MKTNNILTDIYRGIGFPVNKQEYVTNFGFFMLQGLLAGIALNDIWRILNLPGENLPVVIGNQAHDMEIDYIYQLIVAGIVIISSLFGVKHASGFGIGMAMGSTFANISESNKTISLLPFKMNSKQ